MVYQIKGSMMISQLLVALIVAWYLVVKWRQRHLTRLAEQLKSSLMNLPLIGHMYVVLGNAETTMKGLQRMFRDAIECGGTVTHWISDKLYITVADPEVADIILKNCLEKDDLMNFFHEATGDGSIFTSVKKWRPRRKILVPTFGMKNLTRFVEVFATQSSILAMKLKKIAGQDPFPMWKLLSSYAMDAVCETTLGFKTKAQENDHPSKAALENAFKIVAKRIATPWLHYNFIFKTNRHAVAPLQLHLQNESPRRGSITTSSSKAHPCTGSLQGVKLRIIKDKRENQAIEKNLINDDETDRFKPFVELLLESVTEESEKIIREECLVLMAAGTDTSAVGIGYALVMLATYPEVQERVYRELEEILSDSNRPVQADDLHRLKYLDAVVRETLRLYPPVPVIVRKIEKDIELPSGVIVPAGCGAMISIWGIHHNPAIWGKDVEEFRPERFLDSTQSLRHPAAFIPFSFGPRNCIGYQYAMMSMKTVLCTVLRKFRLVAASEVPQPLRLEFDIMMRDVDQYRVGIEKRQ